MVLSVDLQIISPTEGLLLKIIVYLLIIVFIGGGVAMGGWYHF